MLGLIGVVIHVGLLHGYNQFSWANLISPSFKKYNIMYKITIILAVIFLFCRENNNPKINKTNLTSIIFKNIPDNFSYKFKNGSSAENSIFDVQYFSNEEEINLKLVKSDSNYEEKINHESEFLEIIHSNNSIDEISFLLKKGDIVNISYSNKIPNITITNREIKKHDIDYDFLIRKLIFKNKFPSYIQSKSNPLMYVENFDSLVKSKTTLKNLKEDIFKVAQKEINREIFFLDSLYINNQISPEVFAYYKLKNAYKSKHILLRNNEAGSIDENIFNNDSLVQFKFFRDYIKDYVIKNFKIKQITVSDGSILDSKRAFDLVASSNIFGQKTKKYLIDQYIVKICKEFKKNESSVYLEKYLKLTNDQKTHDKLKSNFFFTKNNSNEKLTLIDTNKKNLNINEIILNKKLVYIDFWASWCAPCRTSFPASRKLHEKYKNKDIEFIYISIDKNFEAWQKAHQKEVLDNKYSFLATNYPDANFYKENQLKSIPRYMLFHNGKLVNNNAPSPDSQEIVKELEKYFLKN